MSDTASSSAPSAQRTAWLLFAPPAALVALRWLLQWQADRGAQTPLLPLTPFTPPTEVFSVLAPFLWGLLVLLGAAFAARWAAQRWGWLPVQRVALVLWLGVCMAGAVGALLRHHNVQGAQSLTPVSAEVLGSRFSPPSMRGTGGTQLIVRVAGLELPQQVLIDDPQAADWQPGQRLLLHWARGARSGYFVTGWLALAAPLAESSSVQAGILLE